MLPAITTTEPDPRVSAQYQFVNSQEIVSYFDEAGYEMKASQAQGVRQADPRFAKHLMRFRPRGTVARVGGYVPEVVVINSHNRTSGFRMYGGVYRFVCANGMVVGNNMFAMSTAHTGAAKSIVADALKQIVEGVFPRIEETVSQWLQIQLDEAQKVRLAVAAATLRAENNATSEVQPVSLLGVRRLDDKQDDLWTVFNVIQENVMRGNVPYGNRFTRPISAIDRTIKLNTELWKEAQALAKELA